MSFDLLESVRDGDFQKTKELLAAGANPNVPDVFNGSTCIHAAVAAEDIETLQLLLDSGADPNIPTQNTESSPLGIAALHGQEDIAKLLIENGARLSERDIETKLLEECKSLGHDGVVALVEESMSN